MIERVAPEIDSATRVVMIEAPLCLDETLRERVLWSGVRSRRSSGLEDGCRSPRQVVARWLGARLPA